MVKMIKISEEMHHLISILKAKKRFKSFEMTLNYLLEKSSQIKRSEANEIQDNNIEQEGK